MPAHHARAGGTRVAVARAHRAMARQLTARRCPPGGRRRHRAWPAASRRRQHRLPPRTGAACGRDHFVIGAQPRVAPAHPRCAHPARRRSVAARASRATCTQRRRHHRVRAAHLAGALRQSHALPPAERARLFESHAWECNLTNKTPHAVESGEQALALYRELSDTVAQARVLRVLARVYWQLGRRPEAEGSVVEAIALLEASAPGRELAMAYGTRSMLAMLGGRIGEAVEFGERTLELARQFNDAEAQVQALNTIGSTLMGSGDKNGFALVEQALSLGIERGLHDGAGRAFTNLTTCAILHFDLPRAEGYLRRGLAFCED